MALVIAAVELMSWNFLKPVITERIEEATGRSAAIHGDVELSLFPRPQLSVHDVEFDNPEWATAPHMLEADQVTVSPSLSDLLQGAVVPEEIEFAGSTLNLEQRADAPGNWMFGDQQDDPQAQADEAGSSPLDIPDLSFSDSKVRYWAADADTPLDVAVSSLQVQAGVESLDAQGTLTFRQRQFDLEAETDPVDAFMNDNQAFGGDLSLTSGESQLTGTFELPQAPSMEQFQLDGELSLDNLSEWSQWLELPQVELESLDIAAQLERHGSEWRLRDIDAAVAESRLTGELTMDTAGEAPSLEGQLHSPRLDVAALRAAMPKSEGDSGLTIPVLPDLRGDVSLSVEQLILEQAQLQNVQAQVQLAEHSVVLPSLAFDFAGSHVEAEANLTSSPERVSAGAQIRLQDLDMSELNSDLPTGATLDADLALELEPLEQRQSFAPDTLLAHLRIDDSRVAYRNAETGDDLEATIETSTEAEPPELLLDVVGTFDGKPLELQARGAPLPSLIDLESGTLQQDYPLDIQATSTGLAIQADTTLASILELETFEADMVLDADSGQSLEDWIGPVLPPMPDYQLAGRLSRDHERWSATRLEGRIGSTDVSGSFEVFAKDRPEVNLAIDAGRIDLAQLIAAANREPEDGEESGDGNRNEDEEQDDSLLAPLRGFDGQLELNANSLVLPNGLELGALVLNAELEDGRLQAQPLQFRLGEGSVTADLALDVTQPAASGRLDIALNDIALTRLGDTFTPIEDRLGRVSGEVHVELNETLPGDRRDDLLLPFIGRLAFEPSELRFSDPQAGTELTLNFATRGASAGNRSFHLEGEGRYDGAPAYISLQGDPLLNARDPNRPYAVDLEADIVDTHISLEGTILRPLALEGLNLELAIEGPNPQRLSRLLGIGLPQLPPYSVSGELDMEGQRWIFTDIQGETGDSDLNGRLTLDTNFSPVRVSGELNSRFLDIEDLGFLAGATPEETDADDRFVLPDTQIITDAWQGVSADISYRGQSVRAGDMPLSNVVLDFVLEDGRGQFEPVGFGIGDGYVDLILDVDSTAQPPSGTMQVEVQGVDLNDALRNWGLADESVGIIGGRGKLWVEGASLAELLASADGGVVLLMTGGRLDALLVEVAGLDAGQTFLSWVRDRDPIPIDCGYADLQMRDGVTQLDTFVMDTDDTTFTLGGQVDLNTERLDISIIAHPKDPSVFVGRSPLHLGGTFNDIETAVHREDLVMRAGASAALAVLAGPLTALLPLVDVGTGPDMAYCQGLINYSREAIEEGDIQ
ncbi:AsmA family protein [Halomonas kashgarensis]|uniref:AsmA family protein n=1 Tax=Halomonas kashgarensis TaxID=3084920 RepID=UPI003217B691